MGRKPRQTVALAERRAWVGDLYLQNWTQMAIAEGLGITQSTVCADLKAICQANSFCALPIRMKSRPRNCSQGESLQVQLREEDDFSFAHGDADLPICRKNS